MVTDFGNIIIKVNDLEIPTNIVQLPLKDKNFSVDGRVKLICKWPKNSISIQNIECLLDDEKASEFKNCVETGEDLALISFYKDSLKLSIGTKGDIFGLTYNYLQNGIQIKDTTGLTEIVFYIAWIKMNDQEKEEIYTWFAADPCSDK